MTAHWREGRGRKGGDGEGGESKVREMGGGGRGGEVAK